METPETKPSRTTSNPPENGHPPKRRKRTGRKRTSFRTLPRPAWPVRGLWESATKEEREEAHRACMRILEYWLGKKTKAEVAEETEVKPLRVWQLSQQALSGMLAGLLKQPRRRVTREAYRGPADESPAVLKRRIATLERELARTEDLVRVLRMAPWQAAGTESGGRGKGARRAGSKRKTSKGRPHPRGEGSDRQGDRPAQREGAG